MKDNLLYEGSEKIGSRHKLFSEGEFRRAFRLSRAAFGKLFLLVLPSMLPNEKLARRSRGSVVPPEVRLMLTLRLLAGGSYLKCHDAIQSGALNRLRNVSRNIGDA